MLGFVQTTLGRRTAGERDLAKAQEMAKALGNPVTDAFCARLRGLGACFAGDCDRALERIRECVEVYGPWLELNEYCLDISNADLVEALRGRPLEGWSWIERAIARGRRADQ